LRGVTDNALSALIDLFIALPGLVLALIITVMVGANLRNLILVLGFVMWPPIARLVRGQALAIREALFVEAARAVGGTPVWIMRRHVWPSVVPVVAAQFAISVSFAIFTSASLSFLGLGIPPPAADWGGMVRAGYDYLAINPWMSLAPGGAVSLTVMGFYVIGRSFR
jgi:peptide/nickel transport system permease protein